MSDRELAQVTFAMRIFDHDVDISYSTREPAAIRDHMATLGVTTMSAESKTEPGGILYLSAGIGAVPCERRTHSRGGGEGIAKSRS